MATWNSLPLSLCEATSVNSFIALATRFFYGLVIIIIFSVLIVVIIYMKKIMQSDWLREVQFFGNTVQKRGN